MARPAAAKDPAYSEVKAGAVYNMRVQGIVLMSMERGLYVRADGALLRAKAHVRPGEATLTFQEVSSPRIHNGWRARLARRLLGL